MKLSERIRANVASSRKETCQILGVTAQVLMSQGEELHVEMDDTQTKPSTPVGSLADRIRKAARAETETFTAIAAVTDEMCNVAASIALLSETQTAQDVPQKLLSE